MIGIINAVVSAAGTKSKPACVAVHPRRDWVYKGIINVDPYKPKPSMNDKIVPTRRLPFFRTRKLTTGLRKVSSRQIKKNALKKLITERTTIILLLNQSSSCPFSKIY